VGKWTPRVFLTKNLVRSFSEEVEVLGVVLWSWEFWFDVVDEVIIVLSVDHPVEHWIHVSMANSHEVDIDGMPGIEHDWGDSWVHPLLVLLGHVEGLDGSLNEGSLVMDDNLVLLLLGDLEPVLLDSLELMGMSDLGNVLSETNNLWDLVHSVVLHLSELVVLLVESVPLIVVNVDDESVVWILTDQLGGFFRCFLELHVGHFDLVHLSLVHLLELLHLWGWASLVDGFDVLAESLELIGVDEILNLTLELFAVVGVLHLHLVFAGLHLESFAMVLKRLNFLLLEFDLEHLSGLSEITGSSGDDGGNSGELVHVS